MIVINPLCQDRLDYKFQELNAISLRGIVVCILNNLFARKNCHRYCLVNSQANDIVEFVQVMMLLISKRISLKTTFKSSKTNDDAHHSRRAKHCVIKGSTLILLVSNEAQLVKSEWNRVQCTWITALYAFSKASQNACNLILSYIEYILVHSFVW